MNSRNRREKSIMEFNQSEKLSSISRPSLQMHEFMPMPAPTLHDHEHQIEKAKISCFMNHLKQNMQIFWKDRLAEICEAPADVRGQNTLPLARIKKVMKSDEQVKMISADTPVVFAKACEMFIMEVTLRAWMHTQQNKRRTLQRNDVANAIRDDEDLLLFLKDIVPMENIIHQEEDPVLSQAADYSGVLYVPHPHSTAGNPTQPIYSVLNMQQSIDQAAVMGAYFTRNHEIQQGPVLSQPPPPANYGTDPNYFGFK